MVNYTWWPTTGDGYLLPAIASVFVGGTPTWGGVGTITGGAIGALTVSFIQSGIVAAGLSGFYVQFFNGLIIILALLFAGGGGYYGYSRWGAGGGLGIVGTVIVIVLVLYLLGAVR